MLSDMLGEWTLQDKLLWWDCTYCHIYIPPALKKYDSVSEFSVETMKGITREQFSLVDDIGFWYMMKRAMTHVMVFLQTEM